MPKARDLTLPQHEINQGHFGELSLEFFPNGVSVGDSFVWDGSIWTVDSVLDGKVKISALDTAGYLEDKLQAGANITLTVVDGKIEIASTASGGGTGEVLVADGVTDPPEQLTNEAGDDWLYEG